MKKRLFSLFLLALTLVFVLSAVSGIALAADEKTTNELLNTQLNIDELSPTALKALNARVETDLSIAKYYAYLDASNVSTAALEIILNARKSVAGPYTYNRPSKANIGFSNELGQNMGYVTEMAFNGAAYCGTYYGATIYIRGSTNEVQGIYGLNLYAIWS